MPFRKESSRACGGHSGSGGSRLSSRKKAQRHTGVANSCPNLYNLLPLS